MNKLKKWLNDNEGEIFSVCAVMIIVVCIGMLIYSAYSDIKEIQKVTNEVFTYEVELMSLDLQSDIQGSFILGSGSVNSEHCYAAYQILDDGGKKLFTMPAYKTVIYDTLESEDGAYAVIEEKTFGGIQKIKLYVPKGTITQEYDLSLK